MIIGYARVSTEDQNQELQLDALKSKGCEEIYTDQISGTKKDRPALEEMLSKLRKGDTVVVWKLDRLGRSLKHLIELIEGFKEKGVEFISLSDSIDTTTAAGNAMFQMIGVFAEFERNLNHERTMAGLKAARARGRIGGRKEKLTTKQIVTLQKMYQSKEHSLSEMGRTFGISKPTIYRYLLKEVE